MSRCEIPIETSIYDLATIVMRLQGGKVISARENPNIPLARYRAKGQLTELRAADLRFTHAEAAEFLNRQMGFNLSVEDITALETRTEGWIAGLQLAAIALQGTLVQQRTISMQGYQATTSLIHSFTGSHPFVLDYLVEEKYCNSRRNR